MLNDIKIILYKVKEHILFMVNERCNELLFQTEGNWFYDLGCSFSTNKRIHFNRFDFDENGNRRTYYSYRYIQLRTG